MVALLRLGVEKQEEMFGYFLSSAMRFPVFLFLRVVGFLVADLFFCNVTNCGFWKWM
jgi:hypothetical protein